MLTLGIETASEHAGVAILHSDWGVELLFPAGRGRGELLPQAVDSLLHLAEVKRADLGLIAVDIGPGSFTGLRIGVALAKGMAQALGIPVVGVRQTEVVGRPLAWWPGPLWVWIRDRREHVFAAALEGDRAGEEVAVPWPEALRKIRKPGETLLVGSGAVRFREEIRAAAPEIVLAAPLLARPRPIELARLGLLRFQESGPHDLLALEPRYVHEEV